MTPPASDHFNGKTFFQPGEHPERSFRHVLKWRLTAKTVPWPKSVPLVPETRPEPRDHQIVATWLGHASFLLRTTRETILIDPVFSDRASPFTWIGPRRVHPVPLALGALAKVDVVCLSHDHYDHCDVATLRRIAFAFPEAQFLAPLRHRDLLVEAGARTVHELDWWQSWRSPAGTDFTLTPSKHWSNRLGSPRNHRLWGGWWMEFSILDSRFSISGANHPMAAPAGKEPIENRESKIENARQRRVWFVGDTGYDADLFREIRSRLGSPDLALVPIGAYEPRWFMAPMHMNPAEAVQLHRDVGAKLSVGMHWGTFQLTDEGRDEPVQALAVARQAQGIAPDAFRVVNAGGSVVI